MSHHHRAQPFDQDGSPASSPDVAPRTDRERIEREIDEEINFHLAARAQALQEAGLGRAEASRTALARFGHRGRIRRACLVQRQWKPIMLQRLHLALTTILLAAAAILGTRSLQADAAYESRLTELSDAVERLQVAPAAAAVAVPESPDLPKRVDFSIIAVGDVLGLLDQEHPDDIHVACTVGADGKILLDQVGWVMVAGKTLEEIDAVLNAAYEPFYAVAPRLVTVLKEAAPTRVAVKAEQGVAPGDTLLIFDQAHPGELNLAQRVNPDGTLLLPELGRFHVAGLTRSDLESVLQERYEPFRVEQPVIRVVVNK